MIYDLIILGAGAAGMTSSIYASRYKINHLIFGDKVGGQFVDAHVVENYPGFTSISGFDLTQNFRNHVESYGVKIREEKIGGVEKVEISPRSGAETAAVSDGKETVGALSLAAAADYRLQHPDLRTDTSEIVFEVKAESGEKIQAKSLILAMGARHRALNIPGEDKFLGRGVSYCSTCDAPLFKNKIVAVVGGGNSAITAAIHLSEFAAQVYLIHRRGEFEKADPVWLDALNQKKNVIKIFNSQVKELFGDKFLTGLRLLKSAEGKEETLPVEGVFIEIGLVPAASLANQIGVAVDVQGYISAQGDLATNVLGVYAAGDVVKQSDVPQLRQMVTSAGQGAIAAHGIYSFLNQQKPAPDWG